MDGWMVVAANGQTKKTATCRGKMQFIDAIIDACCRCSREAQGLMTFYHGHFAYNHSYDSYGIAFFLRLKIHKPGKILTLMKKRIITSN